MRIPRAWLSPLAFRRCAHAKLTVPAEDNVRPVIFYARQATCWQPRVKGLTLMVNSIYNGSRFEDLWLED